MKNQSEKSKEFVELHQSGNCFVIPNPWDCGSAKLLQHLGFKALASTSAGFAFSQGRSDPSVHAQEMLGHLSELAQSTDLPISADMKNGFGHTPEEAAQTIIESARAGVVGCSIEDASGNASNPIYDMDLAVERIQSAVAAAKSLDFKFTLTARAENYVHGRADIQDTIRRLQAYQAAGADVLFAPGIRTKDEVKTILRSIDRPLNVMMGLKGIQLTVAELQDLGVTRISLGGSLARAAFGALVNAAKEVQLSGTFGYASESISGEDLNNIFSG